MRHLSGLGIFSLLCAASLGAQSTVVVSGGGDALNRAIQQASPGDELVVRAGAYDALFVDRGVRIECDLGVQFAAAFGNFSQIVGVPGGQIVTVRGGEFGGATLEGALQIDSCAGVVQLQASEFEVGATLTRVEVRGSASVHFDRPRFPPPVSFRGNGWELHVEASDFSMRSCSTSAPLSIEGSDVALEEVAVVQTQNRTSLRATNSTVAVTGGVYPGSNFNIGLISLAGIELTGSVLSVTGEAEIRSGNGQIGLQGAIEGDAATTVHLDPTTRLLAPGAGVRGAATVLQRSLPYQRLVGPLTSGGVFGVDVHGVPSDVVYVFYDVPGPVLPTPFGPLWISPSAPLFDAVTIPASGVTTASFTVPNLPPAVPVVFQSIRVGQNGELTLGTPSRVLVN